MFFKHIAAGAARAGRTLADLDLQAGGVVAFSDDLDQLLAARKPGLAFTLGAMGSRAHNFYNAAFQRAGYEDTAIEVQRLWLEGDATRRRRGCPTRWCSRRTCSGPRRWCGSASAPTGRPASPRSAWSRRRATLDERLATLGRLMELVRDLPA